MYLCYINDVLNKPVSIENGIKHLVVAAVVLHENDWNTALFELSLLDHKLSKRSNQDVNLLTLLNSFTGPLGNKAKGKLLRSLGEYTALEAQKLKLTTWALLAEMKGSENEPGVSQQVGHLCELMLNQIGAFCWQHDQHGIVFAPLRFYDFFNSIVIKRRQINLITTQYEWGESFKIPTNSIIEDPVQVDLGTSPFTQLATLNAFLAEQRVLNNDKNFTYNWDSLAQARADLWPADEPSSKKHMGIKVIDELHLDPD